MPNWKWHIMVRYTYWLWWLENAATMGVMYNHRMPSWVRKFAANYVIKRRNRRVSFKLKRV